MRLFADDCLVHRVIKQDSDCLQLQKDTSSLCHWENTWKMTFNKTKRCVMHMIHKKNLCLSNYNMRGVPLVPTHTRKYLGVQLTSNLDWGTHVQPLQPRLIGLSDYSDAISNTVLLALKRQHSEPWCDPRWSTVAPYGIQTKKVM